MHWSPIHRIICMYYAEPGAQERSVFFTSFRKPRFVIVEDLTSFTLHDNNQKSKRGFFCLFRIFLSNNFCQRTTSAPSADYAGGELFSTITSKLGKIWIVQCLDTNYSLEKSSNVLCKSCVFTIIWSLVLTEPWLLETFWRSIKESVPPSPPSWNQNSRFCSSAAGMWLPHIMVAAASKCHRYWAALLLLG